MRFKIRLSGLQINQRFLVNTQKFWLMSCLLARGRLLCHYTDPFQARLTGILLVQIELYCFEEVNNNQ